MSWAFAIGAGWETGGKPVTRSGGLLVEDGGRDNGAVGDLLGQPHRHTGELMAGVKAAPEERNWHCEKDSGQCTRLMRDAQSWTVTRKAELNASAFLNHFTLLGWEALGMRLWSLVQDLHQSFWHLDILGLWPCSLHGSTCSWHEETRVPPGV